MKTQIQLALGLAALVLMTTAHAGPPMPNPEQMDLDPDIQAKIMKEKSKRNTALDGMAGGSSSKECGNVNINSNDSKKGVGSGMKDMFGKQSTTIVTGPVINMANCK